LLESFPWNIPAKVRRDALLQPCLRNTFIHCTSSSFKSSARQTILPVYWVPKPTKTIPQNCLDETLRKVMLLMGKLTAHRSCEDVHFSNLESCAFLGALPGLASISRVASNGSSKQWRLAAFTISRWWGTEDTSSGPGAAGAVPEGGLAPMTGKSKVESFVRHFSFSCNAGALHPKIP